MGEEPEKLVEQEPKPRATRNHDNREWQPLGHRHISKQCILEYLPYTYQREGREGSKQANKLEHREASWT